MATTDIIYTTRKGKEFTGILAALDGDHELPGIFLVGLSSWFLSGLSWLGALSRQEVEGCIGPRING